MGTRKAPDETVKMILDAAEQLYMEKGYERTSLADIQKKIGLSRGAIYHHFESKDEIIKAVTHRMMQQGYGYDWKQDDGLNALEKFRCIVIQTYRYHTNHDIFRSQGAVMKNPLYLSMQFSECINFGVPQIRELVEMGKEDGSMHVTDVSAASELICLLLWIWCIPAVFPGNAKQAIQRFTLMGEQLAAVGVPLINDELLDEYQKYVNTYK